MVTRTMDINPDPGCYRVMNPDIVLDNSPVLDNAMALGDRAGHSDQHGLGTWALDILMITGCGPDCEHLCSLE